MSESETYQYVCDECGALAFAAAIAQIPEGVGWYCAECGSSSAWEFTDARKAREHSEHIRRGVASGLFRRV